MIKPKAKAATLRRLLLGILLAPLALQAQNTDLTIEITQGVTDPIPIAIVPFGAGAGAQPFDVAEVVAADLRRSGMFRPMDRKDMIDRPTRSQDVKIDDWRLLRNDYVLVGRVLPESAERYIIHFELINALNGQQLLNYRQPATPRNLRAASHKVADLVFEKLTGIRGAFSTRIAYVSVLGKPPKRQHQLIIADADGENPRVIAQSDLPIMSPAWAPDGSALAYVSFENKVGAVFTQNLRTGERKRIATRAGAPAWSPDGKKLALTIAQKDGNIDIHVCNVDDPTTLTRLTRDASIDTEPTWSLDGRSLYFNSDRSGNPQIYSIDAASGGQAKRVTFDGSYNARPRLSPDGEKLAVVTLDGGSYRIGLVDLKKGGMKILSKGREEESPSFAPNGAMLIYGTLDRGRGLLATVSIDGRVHQRLGADAAGIQEPVWSPF